MIRPADKQTAPEYFLLVRFETLEQIEQWKQSDAFEKVRTQSKEFVVNTEVGERQYGVDMFFSRPLNNIYYPKPPLWKQMVVGTISVYPIILASNLFIAPFLSGIENRHLALFVSLIISSPLFIFVLPMISSLFKNWLYPSK